MYFEVYQTWTECDGNCFLLPCPLLKMPCSETVKSGEAVEGDEADEGLPVDSDAWTGVSLAAYTFRLVGAMFTI